MRGRGFLSVAVAAMLPGIGPAVELPNGLFEVQLRTGITLTTHGADGPDDHEPMSSAPPRAPRCADAAHTRVLYGRPALSVENLAVAQPRIEEAIWRVNGALDQAALESGGRHADLRVQCAGDGSLRVDSFVNPLSGSFADVVDAARLAGATEPDADYVIFYEDTSPSSCGVGSFEPDDRPGGDNVNNRGGGYAVVYADCWDDTTALHEIAHTQGAVQPGSPHGTGQGHCHDEADVMCYADGAEGAAGMLSVCAEQRFDCGYDDYFDVATEPGEWLETHWNLGSPANRFLEFSDLLPGEDAADEGCTLSPLWITADVCEPTDEAEPDPSPMRILRFARLGRGRVRIALRCPADRDGACRGDLEVRERGAPAARPRRVVVRAGARRDVVARLRGRARRAAAAGRLRRLRVIVEDAGPAVRAARTVTVRRPFGRQARW